MARYSSQNDFAHDQPGHLGVLMTNLGTPEAPTAAAVRRYLAEFLWDARVVEVPRPVWWLILNGVILRTRPRRSARAYAKVWSEDGSPLLAIARRQAQRLGAELESAVPGRVSVELAMRYGKPSIREAMEKLRAKGARRLLVLPLYPQYSATTTASTFDAVADVLRGWRWIPELRFVNQYHDEPAYIEALSDTLREHWQTHSRGERVLMSFHGIPKRNLLEGDPYHCQCLKTARLLAEKVGLQEGTWAVSFQSRLGKAEWLKPYTDQTLQKWGAEGVGDIDVICPGFSADCLETLEEIALQNGELYAESGGGKLRYVAALNERPDHIGMLAGLVNKHIQGWPEARASAPQAVDAELAESRRRAVAAGARQ